uniref:Uncharacterized protein n=1 Tax=Pithovirus LCPAC403 TaxID=2506596 RepID=A0A481ZBS5_9VIRU|nr:MAG: uncharacterized protein LCPAC403_02300 [Pithovirus LCPAC403]
MAPTRSFRYINSLQREYSEKKCVTSVEFAVGRYSMLFQSLEFKATVSERKAVQVVEHCLSKVMTKEYYDILYKDGDLFLGGDPWEEAKKDMEIKGDALSSAIFIEQIVIDKNGNMEIICVS